MNPLGISVSLVHLTYGQGINPLSMSNRICHVILYFLISLLSFIRFCTKLRNGGVGVHFLFKFKLVGERVSGLLEAATMTLSLAMKLTIHSIIE